MEARETLSQRGVLVEEGEVSLEEVVYMELELEVVVCGHGCWAVLCRAVDDGARCMQ